MIPLKYGWFALFVCTVVGRTVFSNFVFMPPSFCTDDGWKRFVHNLGAICLCLFFTTFILLNPVVFAL